MRCSAARSTSSSCRPLTSNSSSIPPPALLADQGPMADRQQSRIGRPVRQVVGAVQAAKEAGNPAASLQSGFFFAEEAEGAGLEGSTLMLGLLLLTGLMQTGTSGPPIA